MARPTSCAATNRRIFTCPVSGSTSTSQNCVENPGACPPAFTDAAEVIGPPVAAAFAAIAFNDRGSNSPTLELAGLANPSSHTTPSGSTSQIIAARLHRLLITVLVASTTAVPVANVTRDPPVTCVYPTAPVPPTL